jgi:hypothetical protein
MGDEYSGREWSLTLPLGTPLLTANQRLHHMEIYRRSQTLQQVCGWLARDQKIPHLERVHIICTMSVTDRRRRDPANWAPTAKACVDGLVHVRVLADDDYHHVTGPDMRLLPGQPTASFTVQIRELE